MGFKVRQFLLVLDNPSGVFRPGDVVSGQCVIQLEGEMHLNQLTIKLKGKAECKWTESRKVKNEETGQDETKQETIKSKHNCMELLYSPGSVYSNLMGTGQHNVGFNFQLPPSNLPSSFEGQFGNIRYLLKAKIDRKGLLASDEKTKIAITIHSPAFHSLQELTQTVQKSNHKTVGLIGGKRVDLNCHLERKGHNIGTSVPITCVVDNLSKKSMTLKASLKQVVTFKAEGQTKTTADKMVVSVGSVIQPKSKQNEVISLVVPSTAPMSLSNCPIIKIEYHIKVTLDIPGSFDLHCELPVIITNDFSLAQQVS